MRKRVGRLLDKGCMILSFTPIVLFVYVCALKKGFGCYSNCSVND